MKLVAVLGTSLLLLTSCGSSPANVAEPKVINSVSYQIPSSCESPEVIHAFQKQIPGAVYIPTSWNPAEGTDLAAVIGGGGIACTYGLASAEIGGRVMWVTKAEPIWKVQSAKWIAEGQINTAMDGIKATEIFVSNDGATSADGAHAWSVNILIGDLWLQIAGGFINDMQQAKPLIDAALSAAL